MSDDADPDDPDFTRLDESDLLPETEVPDDAGAPDARLRRGHGRFGDFEIVRELGRGGMGVVYEAREATTGQTVALKVLDVAGRGYQLDLAMREARSMAKVSHPNTVFLYRAERTESGLLLAMELVDGGTLADLLKREGSLPFGRAVDITLQLIDGLESYDAYGIVHRDVKPSNCFVTKDGKVKIADLGLSRSREAASVVTQAGIFVGTPLYSAPEQLRGESVDRRSDIYSLAATLYELLTGRPPITGSDNVTLVARIMTETPEPLSKFAPGVPKGLDDLVRRALSKKPEQRFATYRSFAKALAPYGSAHSKVTTLGTRGLAFAVDMILVRAGLGIAVDRLGFAIGSRRVTATIDAWGPMLETLLYFGTFALIWDRTPGGALVGLRISQSDRSRLGRVASIVRVAVKLLPLVLLMAPDRFAPWSQVAGMALLIVLVLSARWRNDFRCFHEILSGTRVFHEPGGWFTRLLSRRVGAVVRRRPSSRPALDEQPDSAPDVAGTPERRFGDFVARQRIARDGGSSLWSGREPMLDRQVWISEHTRDRPGVGDARRELNRPARLRWIAGGSTEERAWDAFEAPSHCRTLASLPARDRRMPWKRARPLLGQLASELETAGRDGTMPEFVTLAQLLVKPDDQLLVLDRPLELQAGVEAERFAPDAEGMRSFFRMLIVTFATGSVLPSSLVLAESTLAARPVKDHRLLRDLWDPSKQAEDLVPRIAAELSGDPPPDVELTRLDRLKQVFGSALLGLIVYPLVMVCVFGTLELFGWQDELSLPWLDSALAGTVAFLLPSLTAVVLSGGIALKLEKVQVCRLSGPRSRRLRCLLRSVPLGLAVGCLCAFGITRNFYVAGASLLILVVAMGNAVANPSRHLGDRLAGTYLRPE